MKTNKRWIVCMLLFLVIVPCMAGVKEGKAATGDWEFSLYPQNPLDRVEMSVEDENHGNALYFVGYRKGKVAIIDEKYQMIAQTDYDEVYNDPNVWCGYTYYKGQVALVVRKKNSYGLCDIKGRELLPCQYHSITYSENLEGHGIFTLEKQDETRETWVDGNLKINHIKTPYLMKYKGKFCIEDLGAGDGEYCIIYDLKGENKQKVHRADLMNTPRGDFWDKDWYESACDKWLTKECEAAEKKAAAYYENLGYSVSQVSSYTAYNYVPDRKEQMYYYIVVQADIEYVASDLSKFSLTRSNYIFMYTADRTLRIEGQTNLNSNDDKTDGATMSDVIILSENGKVQCMDRYTGEIRELYTTDPKTLFCDSNVYCNKNAFEQYHLNGILEKREYTESYTDNYSANIRTYTLDYTRDYLFSIGNENIIYILTTGEKINYDWHQGEDIYGISSSENETQMYYITDRIIPINKLNIPVDKLNELAIACKSKSIENNVFWLCFATKEIYLSNENNFVSWSFADMGIESKDCNIWDTFVYDNLTLFCVKEIRQDIKTYKVTYAYHAFAVDAKTGKSKLLGTFDTEPKLLSHGDPVKHLTIGSTCYLYKNKTLYTVDLNNLTIEEKDMTDILNKIAADSVIAIDEINGKPYICYGIPKEKNDMFCGYMDIQGEVVIDAASVKISMNDGNDLHKGRSKCEKYGEYLLFGDLLFDLDFHEVAKNMRGTIMEEYDKAKGNYVQSGLINIYNRYGGDGFIGFLYDENKGEIVKRYKKLTEVYKSLSSYGNYYEAVLSETDEIAWLDKNTMEEVGRGKGFCHINEKKQVYTIFQKKGKSKDTTIVQNCFYGINDGVYQITNVKNKTVTFIETASITKSYTIPNTVKIAGKTFKVTKVNANAFNGNKKLTKVVVGKNVTQIGQNAFLNCKNLKTIVVQTKKLNAVGSNALKGTQKKLVLTVPSAKKKAYRKLWKGKGNTAFTIK